MISTLAVVFLAISGAVCAAAVLYEAVKDTLIQRIALAGMCLGFISLATAICRESLMLEPLAWFSGFCALFALETVRVVLTQGRK